jgi:spermidine synthase
VTYALLFSVFIVASCGLVYELIAGALASYLLGDSVAQFSIIIGTYLFAMGVGSFLSRYILAGLVQRFVQIELLVGLLGGFSAAALFLCNAFLSHFRLALYLIVFLIGVLVGLEIPLITRVLEKRFQFKDLIAQVLSFDYLGALLVSILFPLFLAPRLGLIRTALVFGLLNVLVAWCTAWLFRRSLNQFSWLRAQCLLAASMLLSGLFYAENITALSEEMLYEDSIIYTKSTRFQRMVLTRWQDDFRLYLNGHLQFSSRDEYRYHEALVHPGMQSVVHPRRVLVLGGGDGLAVREILRYPSVESIVLVDLDAGMTKLFMEHSLAVRLNEGSLKSPKLKIVNADAFLWLEENRDFFDFVVVDLPDPTNYSLGKLYTSAFYRLLAKHLSEHGAAVIQSTSPLYARRSFWCVVKTLQSTGLQVTPYHAYVPSFGEWGYVLMTHQPFELAGRYVDGLKFISPQTAAGLFVFPEDMQTVDTEINRLDNQVLVRYHEADWHRVLP